MSRAILAAVVLAGFACAPTAAPAREPSPADLTRRTIERRAVEAMVWGMPAVNTDLMLQEALKAKAKVNEVVYWSRPAEWKTRLGVRIVAIGPPGVTLESGEQIPASTVVWCAGMRANPLTRVFPVERDRLGRIPVDAFMRVQGVANVFAAGDVARAMLDDDHASVMSCQHGRPMGRFAGHNVVCDLFGLPMLPLGIAWYVTVLDLGSWGAVYTEGWDRHVVTKGEAAKKTKQVINCQRIYPPLTGNRQEILAAAAPVVQVPPATNR
jgi:NADH dehydrogenase FAD-containing subunit